MKVVQINAVYEYSSTGRTTKELHSELKRQGHDSYVFCTNVDDIKNGVYRMGTKLSGKIHSLLSRATGLQGYFSSGATKKMLKAFDEIKPDVVHLRNLHGNYINVNMLLDYLVKNQIATVVSLHDCWLFTGHCCHYTEEDCDRWQYGCGKCPAKHKWNKSWFFDRSAKVYRDRKERFTKLNKLTVVGASDWVTNECKKSFMKENAYFVRIYNWIDLDTFSPVPREANGRPTILAVAQEWTDEKGLSDIINIAKNNDGFDFVTVGKMPRDISLPDNILSVGEINNIANLVKLYQKADVLLHLSYQETFGKVIVEALACGTPAVVYDVTAMPELIRPGCGAVVPKGDWQAAGNAVKELVFENRECYQSERLCPVQQRCRDYALENFNMSDLLRKWQELYKLTIDSSADKR